MNRDHWTWKENPVSYLDSPRLHFRGWFQADVSTINNEVRMFQDEGFLPDWQALQSNGSWNPQGTATFRVLDCAVTGGHLNGHPLTKPAEDAAIGLSVQNADGRAPGKLVDLDPQQQMVSEIWGMQLRLVNAAKHTILRGEFEPAAFLNVWRRQLRRAPGDQPLGAYYQSVLSEVAWPGASGSKLIDAIRARTEDGKLSIDFNVWGYGRDPGDSRYTMGHIAGTIGPYHRDEPKHFTVGRQLIAGQPPLPVGSVQAKVAADGKSITADFGNALPVDNALSGLADIGTLDFGVLNTNPAAPLATVTKAQVTIIGELPYRAPDWYTQTAGVQTFDISANAAARQFLPRCPVVLLQPVANSDNYTVILQESLDGQFVRADTFVFRMEAGDKRDVEFYASRFGAPYAGAAIVTGDNSAVLSGGNTDPLDPPQVPPAPIPDVGTPLDGIKYGPSVTADAHGYAKLRLTAGAIGLKRGYIAGQLYGVGYQLATQPAGYVSNPFNFVSVLLYSKKPVPARPTWHADVRPLLTQYGNLYPIMSKYVVDLRSYESVVSRAAILKMAFSLPIHDPNHMPVTRDLGASDRAIILAWLDSKGPDGLPPRGTAPPGQGVVESVSAPAAAPLKKELVGKSTVMARLEMLRAAKGESK